MQLHADFKNSWSTFTFFNQSFSNRYLHAIQVDVFLNRGWLFLLQKTIKASRLKATLVFVAHFLPIHHWFSSRAAGVITTWRTISRARRMTRIRNILCGTAMWAALRITRKMARSRARDAGTGGQWSHDCRSSSRWRRCSWSSILCVHRARTTVVIAIRETVVVTCPGAWREHGR